MNLIPIACVNHILNFVADMENKKYIPVFEESGKLNWKINANIYQNISRVIKHKKENAPSTIQYRIVNAQDGTQSQQPILLQSLVLPERENSTLTYMWNENTYIEKYNKNQSWHGNLHRPNHQEKSERYKYILYMDENEIMIHSTPLFANQQMQVQQIPQDQVPNEEQDIFFEEEEVFDDSDNEFQYDEYNEDTFNFTEEEMEEFQNEFVFSFTDNV